MKTYWPGNVRELRNVIDRAILLETTDKIGLSSIFIESADSNPFGFNVDKPEYQIEPPTQGVWRGSPLADVLIRPVKNR